MIGGGRLVGKRRRKRASVTSTVDHATGAIDLYFSSPPNAGAHITATYNFSPPEPSVVDRLGAIESPELAKRVEEYDRSQETSVIVDVIGQLMDKP